MKTTSTVILAAAFVLAIAALFIWLDDQARKTELRRWADQCQQAGGGVAFKNLGSFSTRYECRDNVSGQPIMSDMEG